MKQSYINKSFNSEIDSMDVTSDDYVNDQVQRQVNSMQGKNAQVNIVKEGRQVTNVPMQLNEREIRGNTESRSTRDIRFKLKQHKWSILAFMCGVILTLVIVVPVMVSKSSSSEKDDQAEYIYSLRFDRKSAHSLVFLSDDNTVLGNSYTKETPNPVNHPERFKTFIGTIGDRYLTSTSKIYFEIKFSYEILRSLNFTHLVIEVGVASRQNIDTDITVERHGWSFLIHNCNTSICLTALHSITNIDEQIKIISRSNTAGTLGTGRLGFFVNMNSNEFSVIDKDTSKILYTLTKLVSADQLCLAFGVYNPEIVEAKLEIVYSYDFTNLPIINVVA